MTIGRWIMKFCSYREDFKFLVLYFMHYSWAKIPAEQVERIQLPHFDEKFYQNTRFSSGKHFHKQDLGKFIININRLPLSSIETFLGSDDSEESGGMNAYDRILFANDIVTVCLLYENGFEENFTVKWKDNGKDENALQKVIAYPEKFKDTIEIIIGE